MLQGGGGGICRVRPLPSAYHGQMLCRPAQLEEAGDVAALGGVVPAPLGLCQGRAGGHSSSQGRLAPTVRPRSPGPAGPPHPPGSRSGTRCSTCCGWRFSRSPRCSPTRCRPGAQGRIRELRAGTSGSACASRAPMARARPKLGVVGGVTDPNLLPFLGTNCDVTPTSKVAKTGEWSLVTMSSVQPGWREGTAG